MTTDTSTSRSMIHLTAYNYTIWKPRMEDRLYRNDLYDVLNHKGVQPTATTALEWTKSNRKTIGEIREWIDQSIFHHVAKETDAHKLWTTLETLYQSKTSRNKALLMCRLVNLKYRDNKSINEHTSEFQDLVNQLATAQMDLKDAGKLWWCP